MMVHTCHPNTWETKAEELSAQGQLGRLLKASRKTLSPVSETNKTKMSMVTFTCVLLFCLPWLSDFSRQGFFV